LASSLDQSVPAPGVGIGVVGRPDHPLAALQVLIDLPVSVDMVSGRDHVCSGIEELLRRALGDPHPAGGVLPVDDDELRLVALP